MCGRFTLVNPERLMERYGLDEVSFPLSPRYNVAPTQMIPGIIHENEGRKLVRLKWGLIPWFSKDSKQGFG